MPETKKQFTDKAPLLKKQFADFAVYSSEGKTAISMRDGVLEYLGSELGLEPANKIFTVYRSPATIANAAFSMKGIPLTDEHVSMDSPPPNTGSTVDSAVIIDQIDETTNSRLAVLNKLTVSDTLLPLIAEKRQMSLGYEGDLVPHSQWDYEQINIIPHHLAAVPAGRCGSLCSFLDRKQNPSEDGKMKKDLLLKCKAFVDENGAVSLEQIIEIAMALPEAMKKVPVDKLQELMPAMLEVMSYAKEQKVVTDEELVSEENTVISNKELEDMSAEKAPSEEDKAKFADAVKTAVSKEKQKFADEAVKLYASVVNKARTFLDAEYDFTDKTANQIMKDALATQHGETEFTDSELSTAFKLLKKQGADYTKFGDSAIDNQGGLLSRIESSLK